MFSGSLAPMVPVMIPVVGLTLVLLGLTTGGWFTTGAAAAATAWPVVVWLPVFTGVDPVSRPSSSLREAARTTHDTGDSTGPPVPPEASNGEVTPDSAVALTVAAGVDAAMGAETAGATTVLTV
ncbi:hypothetical protein [Mycolicibacterium hodleri]|uniref:hypothetical protein n=1 Tax=Mycolicibacterium hodleri TaxID=49897 RepID=UPI001C8D69AD|nr:hypothetical protein [Mycolicibacterium hodleri]